MFDALGIEFLDFDLSVEEIADLKGAVINVYIFSSLSLREERGGEGVGQGVGGKAF